MLGSFYNFRTTKKGKVQFRRKTPNASKTAIRGSWTDVWHGGQGALKGTRHRLQIVREKSKPKNRDFDWRIFYLNDEYELQKRPKGKV